MVTLLNALTPILVLVISILGLRLSVAKAAFLALISTLITTAFIWQMPTDYLSAASAKGIFIGMEIGLILIGALFFMFAVNATPIPKLTHQFLDRLTPNRYAQAIIIGFFLVALIEGAAGFGTPALIAAPILITLGFKPLSSVVITLVGNSAAVTFGAMSTPILIGINQGIDQTSFANLAPDPIQALTQATALINFLPATLIPILIIFLLSRTETINQQKPYFFGLLSGLSFSLPYLFAAYYLNPQLPTLFGAFTGLIITVILAKHHAGLSDKEVTSNQESALSTSQKIKLFTPYSILFLLLVTSRLPQLPIHNWLNALTLNSGNLFSTQLTHSYSPFYSPGFLLILAGLLTLALYHKTSQSTKVIKQVFTKAIKPIGILTLITIMVQLMRYSAHNLSGLPSIPEFIGASAVTLPLPWIIIAPFVGLFGAFVTGSATVSNLLFSGMQLQAAGSTVFSGIIILSLQTIGAAAGNMIALHNLVAVSSIVGGEGQESKLIKTLTPKAILYTLVSILSATLIYLIT